MSVEVKFDGELGGIVDRIARGVSGGAARTLLLAAEHAAGEVRRTAQTLNSSGKARGSLARSFKAQFNGVEGDTLSAGAYSDLPYAAIQNEGGVIKPKSGKMLAVPLKGAGVPTGKWPRDFSKGALFRVGNTLAKKTGAKGKIKFLFALKPSVRIPATGYLDFAQESAEPGIVEIMAGLAQRAIEEA